MATSIGGGGLRSASTGTFASSEPLGQQQTSSMPNVFSVFKKSTLVRPAPTPSVVSPTPAQGSAASRVQNPASFSSSSDSSPESSPRPYVAPAKPPAVLPAPSAPTQRPNAGGKSVLRLSDVLRSSLAEDAMDLEDDDENHLVPGPTSANVEIPAEGNGDAVDRGGQDDGEYDDYGFPTFDVAGLNYEPQSPLRQPSTANVAAAQLGSALPTAPPPASAGSVPQFKFKLGTSTNIAPPPPTEDAPTPVGSHIAGLFFRDLVTKWMQSARTMLPPDLAHRYRLNLLCSTSSEKLGQAAMVVALHKIEAVLVPGRLADMVVREQVSLSQELGPPSLVATRIQEDLLSPSTRKDYYMTSQIPRESPLPLRIPLNGQNRKAFLTMAPLVNGVLTLGYDVEPGAWLNETVNPLLAGFPKGAAAATYGLGTAQSSENPVVDLLRILDGHSGFSMEQAATMEAAAQVWLAPWFPFVTAISLLMDRSKTVLSVADAATKLYRLLHDDAAINGVDEIMCKACYMTLTAHLIHDAYQTGRNKK